MPQDLLELHSLQTDNILNDSLQIIEEARRVAYQSANIVLVKRNWLLGCRISSENLGEMSRAEYGTKTITTLATELTRLYGKGFDYTNLYRFVKFYQLFPNILTQ